MPCYPQAGCRSKRDLARTECAGIRGKHNHNLVCPRPRLSEIPPEAQTAKFAKTWVTASGVRFRPAVRGAETRCAGRNSRKPQPPQAGTAAPSPCTTLSSAGCCREGPSTWRCESRSAARTILRHMQACSKCESNYPSNALTCRSAKRALTGSRPSRTPRHCYTCPAQPSGP